MIDLSLHEVLSSSSLAHFFYFNSPYSEGIAVSHFKMDPLSVMASVVGLMGATGKVASVLCVEEEY
jgi:hypothetical protein